MIFDADLIPNLGGGGLQRASKDHLTASIHLHIKSFYVEYEETLHEAIEDLLKRTSTNPPSVFFSQVHEVPAVHI